LQGEEKSTVLKKVTGTKAKFKVDQKYLFVRARIVSTKKKDNPYQEDDVEMAWTQPVYKVKMPEGYRG
jgi:DNA-directed RNA polymerase subunit E'/Rpb7